MGFRGPRRPGLIEQSGVALDPRGNVQANTIDYRTWVPKLFAAGDMRRGSVTRRLRDPRGPAMRPRH